MTKLSADRKQGKKNCISLLKSLQEADKIYNNYFIPTALENYPEEEDP